MTAAALKIMAKYGWKDGEGLGKEKEGVTSYIKVSRRDPKTSTGLGHVAEGDGALSEATTSELDSVFRSLAEKKERQSKTLKKEKPKETVPDAVHDTKGSRNRSIIFGDNGIISTASAKNKERAVKDGTIDFSERIPLDEKKVDRLKREREELSSNSNLNSTDEDESDEDRSSASNSSTSSEENAEEKPLTDEELFRRCGRVRLGRGGRHRFFNGKLAREEGRRYSHAKA